MARAIGVGPSRENSTDNERSARLAGGALVILTVFSAGAHSYCSSHKLCQLQLATTGARPARPEWAQWSDPLTAIGVGPSRENSTDNERSARLAGGALVILTVFSAGAHSYCSSHKLCQLQLATTGARPARPEWAQWSDPLTAIGVGPSRENSTDNERSARLAGGALVILTVFSAGAHSYCSSHKLCQLQLATTGARPARPEWAQWSDPLTAIGVGPSRENSKDNERAARQAGGALVILTVFSAGAHSYCSSHKLWQLQLATTGARPARPEWAQWSVPIRVTLGDRTRSSYWLVQPGSIHESFVQLFLGDTVEKYHAWLPPRPFFLSVPPSKIWLSQKSTALAKKRSALLKKKGRVLVGPLCRKSLLDPHLPFPRGGRAVFPQRPANGGRKRTRGGSARFAFSCVESFSFSYRSPRPRRGQAEVLPRQEKGRAASSLSDRNKKRKLVIGGKTRLVECDSTEEPYSIEALARYN
ncbi:hypothetical protein CRG98_038874 [Punica granatum]|uniref:Uncharacterized protein n=1 Tax=Punica granatum TaxID=22663 RepID=A0A2I0IBJ1_PUNGR|nr:hypothetical protein CRG98_038874 [Punica granatum]